MADQGLWFKLWCSAPNDPDIGNLSLEDFARWCLLGTYLKVHGNEGIICVPKPARALQNAMRCMSYEEVILTINKFPNCDVREEMQSATIGSVALIIEWKNWSKYQGDYSTIRSRKWRDMQRFKRRGEEKRGEETRREVNTPIVPKGTDKVLEWFEKTWQAYPKERRIGKKAALRSYQKDVKTLEEAKRVARALDVYLKTETVKNGYVRNASTFFSNWRDHDDTRVSEGISGQATDGRPDHDSPGSREQVAVTHDVLRKLSDSKALGAGTDRDQS